MVSAPTAAPAFIAAANYLAMQYRLQKKRLKSAPTAADLENTLKDFDKQVRDAEDGGIDDARRHSDCHWKLCQPDGHEDDGRARREKNMHEIDLIEIHDDLIKRFEVLDEWKDITDGATARLAKDLALLEQIRRC